jgi:hypothetical protein
LSLTVTEPARGPVAVGENVTATEQLAPAANVAGASGQSLVSPKSGVTSMLLIASAAPPVLVIATACGVLLAPTVADPKPRIVGLRPTEGTGTGVAVPVSATDCGVSVALSSKVSVAALSPADCGAKTTSTVQLPPAGTPALRSRVVVRVKSAAPAPASLDRRQCERRAAGVGQRHRLRGAVIADLHAAECAAVDVNRRDRERRISGVGQLHGLRVGSRADGAVGEGQRGGAQRDVRSRRLHQRDEQAQGDRARDRHDNHPQSEVLPQPTRTRRWARI